MNQCSQIVDFQLAEKYLMESKKTLSEFDEQLDTNGAFIFRLNDDKIILIPGTLNRLHSCILFQNKSCFDEALAKDYFPVENYDKSIEEYDFQGLRKIGLKIQDYMSHLKKSYSLKSEAFTRDNVQDIYTAVLKNKKRTHLDLIALGAVMGEILRIELNGKWISRKWYGTYNPYYSPYVLFEGDKLASVYDTLYSMIESHVQDANKFFIRPAYGSRKVMIQSGVVFQE